MKEFVKITECLSKTGYDYINLLELTGVFGIHSKLEFAELAEKKLLKHCVYYDDYILTISIESEVINTLRVQIKSPDNIYIDYFRLNQDHKGKNLGFWRHSSQIDAATHSGFKRLTLLAYGDFKEYPRWDGYIVWGKYGFDMFRKDEIYKFKTQMKTEGLHKLSSICDLVETRLGACLWKYIGNTWEGEFDLKVSSKSQKVFMNYGINRGLFKRLTVELL